MSPSPSVNSCPGCGAHLKTGAVDGLCARCLFGALMSGEPPQDTPPAAERFGDYELLGVIARGGAGVVHRARHVELDRVVALKILPQEFDDGTESLERFRAEAAAAASLEHSNIVPVYECGRHGGRHFLAMKLIEGQASAVQMKPAEAVTRLISIAHAVHHAHQRGVLHRDLKPANILLDAHGEPHLTDFGLAKLTASDSTITRTRAILGTPAYMAPEQAAGNAREITTAADVYGLGAVLYHWLTGGPPFAGGTTVETIRQVLDREAAPPSAKNREVDADLGTICLKCLRKEPGARYASADALAHDLQRWQRREPVLARPVSTWERGVKWVRRNRALSAVMAISLSALLTAAIFLAQQNRSLLSARGEISQLAETQRRDLVRLHVATGNRLAEEGDGYAALASFAEAAALDAHDASRLAMHRFRFAATLAQLPAQERAWRHENTIFTSSFSGDGSRAVTASADKTARIWNVLTGEAATPPLPHAAPVWWAGFADGDARVITRTKAGEVFLWDASSGAPCGGPFSGRGDMGEIRDGLAKEIAVSPDGARFALLKDKSVEIRSSHDGSLTTPPLLCTQLPGAVAWPADGTRLAVAAETGEVLVFDTTSAAVLHSLPAGPLRGNSRAPIGWRSAVWSPDGARVALTDRVFAARILPADVQEFSEPLHHHHMVLGSAWNKDGSRLLTWSYDNTLRLWDASTHQPAISPVRLRGPVFDASFSPDGHWMAGACRDGTVSLLDPSSGERRGPLLRHRGSVMDVAWSRDGARLLTSGADGLARLWKVSGLAGPGIECPHGGSVDNLAVSPGGLMVAALSLEKEVSVWSMREGKRVATLPHGGVAATAAWIDEQHLLTVTGDGVLRQWDFPAAQLTRTVKFPGLEQAALLSLRLSPDGRHLAAAFKSRSPALYATQSAEKERDLGSDPALAVIWSPCGRALAAVHREGKGFRIVIHDIVTGNAAPGKPPSMLRTPLPILAVDSGAQQLAAMDGNYGLTILTRTGRAATPVMPHDSEIQAAVFSVDGRILATGTREGMLRLWDAATGEPLSPPLRHASWIMSLATASDSTRFFTGTNGGILSAWAVPGQMWSPEEMREIAGGAEGASAASAR